MDRNGIRREILKIAQILGAPENKGATWENLLGGLRLHALILSHDKESLCREIDALKKRIRPKS